MLKRRIGAALEGTPAMAIAQKLGDLRWRLRAWHSGSYAQHGEDQFILQYFQGHIGAYIDVGANHPFKISNTYLLYLRGWRGICVEPLPAMVDLQRRVRPRDVHLNIAAGAACAEMEFYELYPSALSTFDRASAEEQVAAGAASLVRTRRVPVEPLSHICQKNALGQAVDLLSIDAEHHEIPVLQGIDWTVLQPRLIVIEVPELSERQWIDRELESRGYREVATRGPNSFFERATSLNAVRPAVRSPPPH